ncbi:MAG: hypothetical protein PHS49_02645 [Candidatus Gracilibacteria bacterium]|nr:hypothetical protein [Candidatus Gracilibacteria bacterium]
MLYLSTYSKESEAFKNKNDLTDLEYEQFKDFRFVVMFMSGNLIGKSFYKLDNSIIDKLKDDAYFSIISSFGFSVSSIYGTYERFLKSEIDELKEKVKVFDKEGLSKIFAYDVEYIRSELASIKIRK